MAVTLRELENELMPLYEQNPERFRAFYNKVYLLLYRMPEGGKLRAEEHCSEATIPLFMKVAIFIMLFDPSWRDEDGYDLLEVCADISPTTIGRRRKIVPSHPLFKGTWYSNLLPCKDTNNK
ncbi:hypothetical protein [Bacteroides sp. UBA939]|uniref:hypothetical protein n=1 Tax=Bacteroides sp. UBA939 TaxID=1946092 RepID=UPI0025C22FD1|nr:hypothetical protein [Bacteroides sp. UBA939]